jgi:hypothetical protein
MTLSACRPAGEHSSLMVVNFQQSKPLTYKLVSSRQTTMDMTGLSAKSEKARRSQTQKMSETLELTIEYTPTKVDPFGLTTIQAKCLSARVYRANFSGKTDSDDAMNQLQGKTYTLRISPAGKIADYADLHDLIRQIGQQAFVSGAAGGARVKNPDMISDFITLQWYLWDTASTLTEPLAGLSPGKTWQAEQFIPWPAPISNPPARLTTFRLDKIEQKENTQIATIGADYALTTIPLEKFPIPYEGRFQLKGTFGFLQNYQFQSVRGKGTQLFDLTSGTVLSDRQQYTVIVNADFLMPLGDSKPLLTVEQTLSIELLNNP